jgi:hypothetical protein
LLPGNPPVACTVLTAFYGYISGGAWEVWAVSPAQTIGVGWAELSIPFTVPATTTSIFNSLVMNFTCVAIPLYVPNGYQTAGIGFDDLYIS